MASRESKFFPTASVNSHCVCQSNHVKCSSPFNYYILFNVKMSTKSRERNTCYDQNTLRRKLHIRGVIDPYSQQRKHDSPVKVPQIHGLQQQMRQPEQQAGNVNAAWEHCETEDKQQAFLMTGQCEMRNQPPSDSHCMGVNIRNAPSQLVEAQPTWTQSLTLLPRRQSLKVMGEEYWQGSLRGRASTAACSKSML